MGQLSFYSADANAPRVTDLAGVLCGPGQATGFGAGTAARLSVVLDQRPRARALLAACAERGVEAFAGPTEDGRVQVRTAFRTDLVDLAAAWLGDTPDGPLTGTVKSVPERLRLDGVTLRMWALVAGRWSESGYLLGLDPVSPQTHQPLVDALVLAGLPVGLVDAAAGGPAVRVTGVRRLARLAELVGDAPPGLPAHDWPAVVSGHRGRATIGA